MPCVFTFVVGACVLIGQLTLSAAGWPESFAAFTLASPLLSVAILAGLAGVAYPPCAHRLPLYGLVAFVALGALQALLGAAVHITPSPPNRVQFALLTAGVVCVAVMVLSKKVMGDALETLQSAGDRARRRFRSAVETPRQSDAEDSDLDDDDEEPGART